MQLAVPHWPKSSYLACCLLCRKARSGVAAHSGTSQRGHGPLLCSKLVIGVRRESWARMSPMQSQHIPRHSACHVVCQKWGIPDKITVPKTQELEFGIRLPWKCLKFKHYQETSKIKTQKGYFSECLWMIVNLCATLRLWEKPQVSFLDRLPTSWCASNIQHHEQSTAESPKDPSDEERKHLPRDPLLSNSNCIKLRHAEFGEVNQQRAIAELWPGTFLAVFVGRDKANKVNLEANNIKQLFPPEWLVPSDLYIICNKQIEMIIDNNLMQFLVPINMCSHVPCKFGMFSYVFVKPGSLLFPGPLNGLQTSQQKLHILSIPFIIFGELKQQMKLKQLPSGKTE